VDFSAGLVVLQKFGALLEVLKRYQALLLNSCQPTTLSFESPCHLSPLGSLAMPTHLLNDQMPNQIAFKSVIASQR
jgi:hypothetical protein